MNLGESPLVYCSLCSQEIRDPQYVSIGIERFFHFSCFRCLICANDLTFAERCYERDGQVYCAKDYFCLFSPIRCAVCSAGLAPTDIAVKIQSKKQWLTVHSECSRCNQCGCQFSTGDMVALNNSGAIVCLSHIEENPILAPVPGLRPKSLKTAEARKNGAIIAQKRRGPRTSITDEQLAILQECFDECAKPSKHLRAKLAMKTGLNMRVIQVWFQNRRSKERRLKHLCNWIRQQEADVAPCDLLGDNSKFSD